MAQYRYGTVSIDSGSYVVSGSSTLWDSAEVAVGNLFNIEGTEGWYYIADVTSNTVLTLTAPYSGDSVVSGSYVIIQDYYGPLQLPFINRGDINWPSIYNEAMKRISDYAFGGEVIPAATGSLDFAYDHGNYITVDGAPVELNRDGTYGTDDSAPALHVLDPDVEGTESYPLSGALTYMYSRNRAPLVSVTNYADRGDVSSPSDTAPAAIVGVARADEVTTLSSYPTVSNVGIVGYSIDFHSHYVPSMTSNVGVVAYSQRGYGLSASSDGNYAIKITQSSVNAGMHIASYRPLTIDSSSYSDGNLQYALSVYSRRAGINISPTETTTLTYPLIRANADTGYAAYLTGINRLEHSTGTALSIAAGTPTTPAVDIATTGKGLTITSTNSDYTAVISSDAYPAIQSTYGINLYAEDHTSISAPPIGTIVYSAAVSGFMVYTAEGWGGLTPAEVSVITLQNAYNNSMLASEGITILSGGLHPIVITSTDALPLQISNTTTTAADGTAQKLESTRGWGLDITSQALTESYGGITIATTAGVGVNVSAASGGKLYKGTTTGVTDDFAVDLECGNGGGISVLVTGESNSYYSPLKLQSDQAVLIDADTDSGKLLEYLANVGGAGYAATMRTGSFGGINLISSSTADNLMRLESATSSQSSIAIDMILNRGIGINIQNGDTGIRITNDYDYSIYADRGDGGPSIYSFNGIVPYVWNQGTITDPVNGTLVFAGATGQLMYWTDSNGWLLVAVPSGYQPPSGSPSCTCICGSYIYCPDISVEIPPEAREEGTIVYDGMTKMVYYINEYDEFVALASELCNCPSGVYVYNWDVEGNIPSASEGTLIYDGVRHAPLYMGGDGQWHEFEGAGSGESLCECPSGINVYNADYQAVSPEEGTIIYDGTTENVYYADSTGWKSIASGGGGGLAPSSTKGVNIFIDGVINVGTEENIVSFMMPFDGYIKLATATMDACPVGGEIDFHVMVGKDPEVEYAGLVFQSGEYYTEDTEPTQTSIPSGTVIHIDVYSGANNAGNDTRITLYFEEAGTLGATLAITEITYSDSPYYIVSSDRWIVANTAGGDITVFLPTVTTVTGIQFTIKKASEDLNTVTIDPGVVTIDGEDSYVLAAPWHSISVISTGSQYLRSG